MSKRLLYRALIAFSIYLLASRSMRPEIGLERVLLESVLFAVAYVGVVALVGRLVRRNHD